MIEQFINFVIRPPRADYNPDQYLWDSEFTLAGRKYKRIDLELTNGRGHTLKCSHYVPATVPENTALPCVIYCHGNSGCRADANEAAVILLPSNITLFTLDFSGSGLSEGDYVSLGWHEKDDLKCVVSYLRKDKQISCIGLWGRSMGAVTSLLYGAEDPSIAGMVLDSAFANLYDLMMELVDVYKIRVPKFTVKMAVQYMRRVIQRRAKFDIMDLNVVQYAPKTFIPALFGHGSKDIFIPPHHCDRIYDGYAGDKNIIKFDGDHNSPRPQFYYDSVSIFFYNVLRPPLIPAVLSSTKLEKYYDLGGLKVGTGKNESLLYEIISSLRAVSTDKASSSSAPPSVPNGSSSTKSVVKLLAESVSQISINNENDLDFLLDEEHNLKEVDGDSHSTESCLLGNKSHEGQNGEECSLSSSNRESWGRCSSLGGNSDDASSSGRCTANLNPQKHHQITLKALATPLRRIRRKKSPRTKDRKLMSFNWRKPKKEKMEKEERETLTQRLRLCFLGHKRAQSA
ncbi:alpha/beta-Hydrolases superfamily protein [Rhynchospora pubera]|uniref:Alpha/beta-Hydrolases superfamily protein n=1 Tax=Rhynchospora pubera TaxID=906938 RepID=A0AAV8CVU8_9POAL|nr:alpha/beta-Hydrolases superfamily protein [Rhynchospora pubera]